MQIERPCADPPPGRDHGRRALTVFAAVLAATSAAWSFPPGASREGPRVARAPAADDGVWPQTAYPSSKAIASAAAFAAAAPGTVSFALAVPGEGVRGLDPDRQFSSASVSKALLLAAELRRLRGEGAPLDSGTRQLLESMITVSDNDAAGSIYARVGDQGMTQVAEAAGMRSFSVAAGYWGGAQVTAADLSRFFLGLDRNLVGPHRRYAKRLLAGITGSQRWGIPAAAGPGWRVYFKGGWRPAETTETSGPVTHQAALLVHRTGRRLGIAVLSDQSPGSTSYATLEGITGRLLSEDPRPPRWPVP